MDLSAPSSLNVWPSLPLASWKDTCETLHMWTQIIGKIRLAREPMINHWWQTVLYVTARGLTTSPISYGPRAFQIDFDFIDHQLFIRTSDGVTRRIALKPQTVAQFYRAVMGALHELDMRVRIWPTPVEVPNPTPFDQDDQHKSYDADYANRFWRVLLEADRVLTEFRARFEGKASPVQFYWGSFDLAVTRFSGRRAPPHPGAPNVAERVTREAYSHEVSSCGFWPGGGPIQEAAFYSYAYPEPSGFRDAPIRPGPAFYSDDLREFILPYERMRRENDPDVALLEFLQTTYEAAANLGHWDRAALERGFT